MTDITRVAVAVIVNKAQQVCISLRHKDVHQGGLWEFPGGKIDQDESIEQALVREIKEELNLDILASRPLITITHQYADKKVCLHVNKILEYRGAAIGVEGQTVKWVSVPELSNYNFPAANISIIKSLQLPNKYLITGKFTNTDDYVNKLKKALANGIKLVQLRLKQGSCRDDAQLKVLLMQTSELCKQSGAKLMLNISPKNIDAVDFTEIDFDGYHLDSKTLKFLSDNSAQHRLCGKLLSASCHNVEELQIAIRLGADFVVLSPVQRTASHPDMTAIGWSCFADMVQHINIPVYALGGVTEQDIETAYQHGAQGVSAISAFWNE